MSIGLLRRATRHLFTKGCRWARHLCRSLENRLRINGPSFLEISSLPRGSIYSSIMELSPKRPSILWLWGPDSINGTIYIWSLWAWKPWSHGRYLGQSVYVQGGHAILREDGRVTNVENLRRGLELCWLMQYTFGSFRKLGVLYFGVLRILLFGVLD